MLNQFAIILPEMMLALLAMTMQMAGVFLKNHTKHICATTYILGLAIVGYLLYFVPEYELGFSDSFGVSPAIYFFKAVVLSLALMSLIIYQDLAKISQTHLRFEFMTLVLLSTLGVFISISAQDFMLLFCGLELQALSGYALAAFDTKRAKSSEAGLKYFVLGALMSALMLLGISFLYGFSGSMNFIDIRVALGSEFNIGLVVGAVLMLSSILFKISAAPLHIWTPDVYEGAPISSVTYFAVAQKIGMLVVLINVLDGVIGNYTAISASLIKIVAIFSMVIGGLGAITQHSLKRLMAYSTILNIGYVLVAVCLQSHEGSHAAFVYMLIYVVGVMGFFACIVALLGAKADEASFDDLKGIGSQRKTIAAAISIIMFSMIGLPPLAGFFGKYYIFYNAVMQGEITLALIGVLSSVVAAYYYLKIIKFMYFMEPDGEFIHIPTHAGLRFVGVITVSFILLFFSFAQSYLF
ncbi:MAG: NADH-quinone oxidoreductase subunit N [Rickettsiales bacterium]|nr:MAG: NADH-quinone oxidoreductase subunit N [Rickettsiales bacterium]